MMVVHKHMVLATPVVQVLIVIHVEALSVVVVHIGNTGIQEIPYIVVIVAPIWDTAIMDTTMAHTATIVLMTMAIHLALVVMDITPQVEVVNAEQQVELVINVKPHLALT